MYLWDENHVGTARYSRPESEPARAMAHDLDNDDAVMAVRGTMEPVYGPGGDSHRRVEAESRIRH